MNTLGRLALLGIVTLALGACGSSGSGTSGSSAPAGEGGGHPLVGAQAPVFATDSLNGQGKISLKGMEGKVVIVDFWATWCEPCKKSFPKLQELNVKYKASGLEIVAISEDDEKGGIQDFGANYGAKFPIGWDGEKKEIASKWQPKSMPSSFVVDRKGVVRFAHLGYHDGDEVELEKQIKALL